MHAVDVIEEVMIGYGLDSFTPQKLDEFSIGRLSSAELRNREVREHLIGLGYQEIISNYLGSKNDFAERMTMYDDTLVEIANPMTESYAAIRNSILPSLLAAESRSAHAPYPHKIFEAGSVVNKALEQNYGSTTNAFVAALIADRTAGFNDTNQDLTALLYYLGVRFELKPEIDHRFIEGRCVGIYVEGKQMGIMGEIHPQVLANWNIEIPCAAFEIDVDEI